MSKEKNEEDLRRSISQYEKMQKQLEVLIIQKHQIQLQLNEVKHALSELKKSEGDVYRSIGSVMIKTTKNKAESELKEKSELLNVKLDTYSKQEEKLRETVTKSQKELRERLKHEQESS